MSAVRLRGRGSDHLLVPARAVRTIAEPSAARALARRLLESPGFEASFDARRGPWSEDEIVEGLMSGALVLVELEGPARRLDEPRTHDLASLAGPLDGMSEPVRPTAWIGVEVVDQRGRPLPFFSVRVDDPVGTPHEPRLDDAARARVDGMGDDGGCTITLLVDGEGKR